MKEPTFEDFVNKQQEIYSKFRRLAKVTEEQGIELDFFMNLQSYLIALIHPDSITDNIYKFSERFRNIVPTVIQPKESYHTTFSNYDVLKGVHDAPYEEDKADKLCDVVRKVQGEGVVEIDFPNWLHNQTTVIVEGYSNPPFFNLAKQIKNHGAEAGIELSLPWGSHITTARFLEKRSPADIADFLMLIREAPKIGVSRSTHIKVGYQRLSPEGFSYEPIELFPLRK